VRPPPVISRPQAGLYKCRLVRGGPWVPVVIRCDDGVWSATVNGEPADPVATWERVYGHPVTAREFRLLKGDKRDPNKAIDPRTAPPSGPRNRRM